MVLDMLCERGLAASPARERKFNIDNEIVIYYFIMMHRAGRFRICSSIHGVILHRTSRQPLIIYIVLN